MNGYTVDLALCIDVTGSMSPVLDQVKQGAVAFHSRLETVMARRGMTVARVRVRVIAYRDFGQDRYDAIHQTPFLTLPDQSAELQAFVGRLAAQGGGDEPESGLEAVALAVQSAWTTGDRDEDQNPDLRRHFIVVFTDASAHPLGRHTPPPFAASATASAATGPSHGHVHARPLTSVRRGRFGRRFAGPPSAPASAPAPSPGRPPASGRRPAPGPEASAEPIVYPRTLVELHDQWGRPGGPEALMDQSAKRLLLFAPEVEPWCTLADTWDRTMLVPSVAGTGLAEVALDEVVSTIAQSV